MEKKTESVLTDVVFLIEDTASTGVYLNELKVNYIVPTLEILNQALPEERENVTYEKLMTHYFVVLYRTSAKLIEPICMVFGPLATPQKVLDIIEKLPIHSGGHEYCANIAEGLAVTHSIFDKLHEMHRQQYKDYTLIEQKFCIMVCNSPPYSMPVTKCWNYSGKTGKLHESIKIPLQLPTVRLKDH